MIWYWPYALKPKRALSALAGDAARRGALIRVDGGFADVHAWPELGDATIDEQLALLARGVLTRLTSRSMSFAALDAAARVRGVSLFEGLTIPASHWPGANPPASFDTVKLKNVSAIPDRVRLRIDFNATLTADEFVRIAEMLPRERVDFVEDPCPYDGDVWGSLRERTGLRLALDRFSPSSANTSANTLPVIPSESEGSGWVGAAKSMSRNTHPPRSLALARDDRTDARDDRALASDDKGGVDVIVCKPAIEETPETGKELVFTSYMDHPVGQLFAAYTAASRHAPPASRHGLITHVLYENDPFIERLTLDGMRLVPPPGTGIGFDDLLETLPWKKLA